MALAGSCLNTPVALQFKGRFSFCFFGNDWAVLLSVKVSLSLVWMITLMSLHSRAANGGSQRVSWRNCTFRDTSSGALMLGGLDTCDEKDTSKWDRDFVIEDSSITNMPVEYTGATAVFFGCESGLRRLCYLRCCPSLPLSVPCMWLPLLLSDVYSCRTLAGCWS